MTPKSNETLERIARRIPIPEPAYERILRRRDRKRRNQRIRAGVLGFAIAIAVGWLGLNAIRSTPPVPADTPIPRDVGSLAYVKHGDIYVADWDGSNAVRIADGHPGCQYSAEGPLWSPDGQYVAYRRDGCEGGDWGDVVISDPDGDVVTSFFAPGWQVAWSPDSTRVAVWVRFEQTIGIYGIDGKRQIVLTLPPDWKQPGDIDPVWMPDGRSLFVAANAVVPIDGSRPRSIDPPLGRMPYSHDGSLVAYGAHGSLVVAERDGSHPRRVELPGDPGPMALSPVWAPTDDRIAFVWVKYASADYPAHPSYHIAVVDVATGTVTTLAKAEEPNDLEIMDFSRDGDRILFKRWMPNGDGSLWSIDADGSDLRRIANGVYWGDWTS